ncbi:MAG: TonB-dependent receptor plug domain-containing protein [Gammaproteobacteria bacterium]
MLNRRSITAIQMRLAIEKIAILWFAGGLALLTPRIYAAEPLQDLTSMSLEELLQAEVTTVSKHAQPLNSAAAAIYVISQDDIRRSGATSLPELLRLAPGVHVGHIDANKWTVSVRGLSGRWANQLLVLMDGRTLYSPLFSGVYWEAQDTVLADIERIEVIRGPGGTLWGSNAVNGVINIITKNAKDTQGGLAFGRYGTQEDGGGFRYGKQLGDASYARAYLKYKSQNDFKAAEHVAADDSLQQGQAGFRIDSQPNTRDSWTLQGDIFHGRDRQTTISVMPGVPGNVLVPEAVRLNNSHLLGRWRHRYDGGEWQVQAYFDRAERNELSLHQGIDTWDVEIQHRFKPFHAHQVIWGGGYRLVTDELIGSYAISFSPERRANTLYNLFVQDEIEFDPTLHFTIGSKFEHNEITGLEVQPSARVIWQPNDKQSLWGSVSRAVRVPSRADRDMRLRFVNVPISLGAAGTIVQPLSVIGSNPTIETSKMIAFELGYRQQVSAEINFDLATFYYDYDQLLTQHPVQFVGPYPIIYQFANDGKGTLYGFELAANWQASEDWRLRGSYSRCDFNAELKHNRIGENSFIDDFEKSGPNNLFQLHSQYQLTANLSFDTQFYWVDSLDTVRDYQRLDMRFAWQPWPGMEFSVVGQNLFDPRHGEALSTDTLASQVPRSFYAQARFSF